MASLPGRRRRRSPLILWAATVIVALAGAATCGAALASPTSSTAAPTAPPAPAPTLLVVHDHAALRAAPRDGAPLHTTLWRGEVLEWRGERGEHVQVWDHRRERGGWLRRSTLHRLETQRSAELLALLAFVRDSPGGETSSLALAAALIQAATPAELTGATGAVALEAIGRAAERLAERASAAPPARSADQAALAGHLELAAHHGVRLVSRDHAGTTTLCYEGDAWRRLLVMPGASAEQQARAALALTRPECSDAGASPSEREAEDGWRAAVLDRPRSEGLPALWRQRLAMRRAALWSELAYARARRGDPGAAREASERAIAELAAVDKAELADADLERYHEAALRVGAVRWAAADAAGTAARGLQVGTATTADGQTCVHLVEIRRPEPARLAQRCTWGLVWTASASVNREGSALALAVQPAAGWRELWVFHKDATGWALQVLPPAPLAPGVGYAELAGWVPGGRQLLVAREAIAEGRSVRRFEVLQLATLRPERIAFEPDALGAFNRWQDPAWRRSTVALR